MRVCTNAPMALMGDRLPAFAPFPTISAISSIGALARCASPMASGASNAVVAIAPGPLVEIRHASTNTNGGSNAARPRNNRTPRCVTACIVPLACAIPNNKVTPSSVKKSDEGKVAITCSTFQSAANSAIGHASATANTPTFTRDVRLTATTSSSANSDSSAGLTTWSTAATDDAALSPAPCVAAHVPARTPAAP